MGAAQGGACNARYARGADRALQRPLALAWSASWRTRAGPPRRGPSSRAAARGASARCIPRTLPAAVAGSRPTRARDRRTCSSGVFAAGRRSRRRGTASPQRRATSSSPAALALDGRDTADGSRRSAARDRCPAVPWSAARVRRRPTLRPSRPPTTAAQPTSGRIPARPRPEGTVRGTLDIRQPRPSQPEACSRPGSRPSETRGR